MAVKKKQKSLTINPLKVSQTVGGTLAFQGFSRSMPIIHGSQGCAAFIKALMTRHYHEPIAVQTSALQEMNVIFDSEKSMIEALDNVIAKHNPEIIGVFSTGLTETAGEDLEGNLDNYKKQRNLKDRFIIPVSLPDFHGSLQSGYCKTVEAILSGMLRQMKEKLPKIRIKNRVNLLPGAHLTPGDVSELKEILLSFGFEVITAPDLSTSLSGHLGKGYSPLSRGGITLDEIEQMLTAEMTIAVGSGMEGAARTLAESVGIPYRLFPSLTGLRANDEFLAFLQKLSGKPVPVRYRWQRENLLDCMLDAHFYFAGKTAVAALEPDHLFSITGWLKEAGVKIRGLVSSTESPDLAAMSEDVIIGDLADLEEMADGVDLWISNSHGKQGAKRKGVPFIPVGFPIFDQIGSSLFISVGYRGTTEMVIKLGNQLIKERGDLHDEGGVCNR